MATTCGDAKRKVTDCEILTSCQIAQKFCTAAKLIGNWQIRQRTVEIIFGKAMADALFEKRHGALDICPAVQLLELLRSTFETIADHRHETGHYRNAVRFATGLRHTFLQACIEALCFGKALLCSKHDISNARCQILTGTG